MALPFSRRKGKLLLSELAAAAQTRKSVTERASRR